MLKIKRTLMYLLGAIMLCGAILGGFAIAGGIVFFVSESLSTT